MKSLKRNASVYRLPRRKPVSNTHPLVKWVWLEMQHQRVSQLEMERISGISPKLFNNMIRGISNPKLGDIEALVNALGYKLNVTISEQK